MKFIHLADCHLADSFNFDKNLSSKIRNASWKSLETIFKDNKDVDFALIAGDLFERSYFSSRDFHRLFSIIRDFSKDVYYVSGNHDYFDDYNSLFLKESPTNFHVFGSSEIEVFESEGLRIYGISYDDRIFDKKVNLNINLDDKFFNIFLVHGEIDNINSNYFSLDSGEISLERFDYIAMGHIHKKGSYKNIYYSGSIEPHDFSDIYDYGYIRYEDGKVNFIDSSILKFYDFSINFSDYNSYENLISYLNSKLRDDKRNFVRININSHENIDKSLIRKNIQADFLDIRLNEEKSLDEFVRLFPNSLLSMYDEKFYGKTDEVSLLARKIGLDAILRSRDD